MTLASKYSGSGKGEKTGVAAGLGRFMAE